MINSFSEMKLLSHICFIISLIIKSTIMENQILKDKKPLNSPLIEKINKTNADFNCKPTPAFVAASWTALFMGMVSYCIGLWNVGMELNEKGYYFTILLFGLFSVVSVQKSVRDRLEGIPVTDMYYGISWFTTIASILLLIIGLWNADLELSEKGFYGMSFLLSLFAAVAVQKNTRDIKFLEQ
jgi:uncharacterized membrane protein YiaA